MNEAEEPAPRPQLPAARVVVGVDGSPGSLSALEWATHEAAVRATLLDVVHVRMFRSVLYESVPGSEHWEEDVLEDALARVRTWEPEVAVEGRVVDPPAAKALIDASEGADMLVVGSRGLGGFQELELGSVSHQVTAHARCPVVVVRPTRRAV